MSKPTLKMNLQYFAEDVETEVVETEVVEEEVDELNLNEVREGMGLQPVETPKDVEEETEEIEPEDDTPIVEEYVTKFLETFEGKHNKEVVKPKDIEDLRSNYEMGLNYNKKRDQYNEASAKIKKFESLIGIDLDEAIKRTEVNNEQEVIEQYADKFNVTSEEAKEMVKESKALEEKNNKIKDLELKDKIRDNKDAAIAKKLELADELYFKELEPEIDKLIQENAEKGQIIDVDTAYKYLLGTNAKSLLADSKKDTVKRTLANVQDRAKRTVQKDAGTNETGVVLSPEAIRQANEMGVSLKKLKARLAKRKPK